MFHRCVGALVGLAMMGMAGSANAILIQANDPAFGAGVDGSNLTQDTATGLEWLDLTLSTNLSYNAVAGGTGNFLAAGFTIALGTEVVTLFINSGAINTTGTFLASQFLAAQTLIGLLGCTGGCASPSPFAEGFSEDIPSGALIAAPFVQISSGLGRYGLALGFFSKTATNNAIGMFLVRPISTIPEPASLALFGIGLAGLGFMTRRRRNRRGQN